MSSPDATQLVDVAASEASAAAGAAETLVDAAHPAASAPLERGALIGRYVVLGHLGAGGMGVVYAAYDPELDRKVALKLLRADHGPGTNASAGRSRLLREAQALARVSHPNIVAIHDVGTLRDRVWLAIEYIEGMTLGAWLKSQARREPEILRVMLAVGHGLIAAHAAGLVHRDLKPDNIMVGADGRVRVMDFGLARAAGRPAPLPARPARVEPADGSATRTRVGAVMGTPAYMAPEQWNGDEVDARADQFAFTCSPTN